MLIVVTGQPHSGKSTLLKKALDLSSSAKHGFLTLEKREPGDNHRSGFELVSSDGSKAVLAGVNVAEGPKVSRYKVDLDSLEAFISNLRDPGANEIAYIDEVGEMELFSPAFEEMLERWLEKSGILICTASQVYQHPVIDSLLDRADNVIEVSPDNRKESLDTLSSLLP